MTDDADEPSSADTDRSSPDCSTTDRLAIDRPSTPDESWATDAPLSARPLSGYVIAVSMLLTAGAGLALVASDHSTANSLATAAYYALVVGVGWRVVGHIAGEQARTAVSNRARAVRRAVRAVADSERLPSPGRTPSASSGRIFNEETERGLRLTVPLTFVGGAALLVRWWLDAGAVPNRLVAGWLLAWGAVVGSYHLVRWYNRREWDGQSQG